MEKKTQKKMGKKKMRKNPYKGKWRTANFKKRMAHWINAGSRGQAVITAGLITTQYMYTSKSILRFSHLEFQFIQLCLRFLRA